MILMSLCLLTFVEIIFKLIHWSLKRPGAKQAKSSNSNKKYDVIMPFKVQCVNKQVVCQKFDW